MNDLHRVETGGHNMKRESLEKLTVASLPAVKDKEDHPWGEKGLEWGGLIWAVRMRKNGNKPAAKQPDATGSLGRDSDCR